MSIPPGYEIDDDPGRIDLDVVRGFLSTAALTDAGPGASFRWLLHTADAHDLYRAHGFAAPDATLLERPARPQEPSSPRT